MKLMKKIAALVLAAAMVFAMFPATVAASAPTVSLVGGTLAKGSTLEVPVNIADNPGLSAVGMKVVYDETSLKLDSIGFQKIDMAAMQILNGLTGAEANVAAATVSWANASGFSGNTMMWLTFSVTDAAFNGDYTVSVEKAERATTMLGDLNSLPVENVTVVPATITVTGGKDASLYTPDVVQSTPAAVTYGFKEAASAMAVNAIVAEGTLSYQWFADGAAIDGATSASYTPATTQCGTVAYTCKVANEFSGHTFTATSAAFTVTVNPATLGGSDVALERVSFVYTGEEITPVIDTELTENTDYTLTGDQSATTVGEYNITVTGRGNYTGKVELPWTITPATITVTGGAESMTIYNNGNAFDITPFVAATVDGSAATIAYTVKEGSEFVTLDAQNGTLTGKGQVGSAVIEVTITAANHTTVVKTVAVSVQNKQDVSDKIAFADGSSVYDGNVKTHETATVTDPALTSAITYRYEGERKNAGTFTVTAIYEDETRYGEKTVTYTITPLTLTIASAAATDKAYDGKTDAEVQVTFSGLLAGEEAAYTATAAFADKNAGSDKEVTFTVTLDASVKNYVLSANTGTATASIARKEVEAFLEVEDCTYNGQAQKTLTVTFTGAVEGETLVEGVDYEVNYTNNVNAGTAEVDVGTLVGSNYTFSGEWTTFEIAPAPLTVQSASVESKTYDGTTAATVTAVTFTGLADDESLNLGTDFTATAAFADKNAGTDKTVSVTVELDSSVKNYALTSGSFTAAADITADEVTPALTTVDGTYTGSELKNGSVTFTDVVDGATLAEGTDYTVAYEANVNAGTAKFIVKPVAGSNYTFEQAEKTFAIAKAEVEIPAAVTGLAYNGTEQTGVILPADAKYTLEGNTATDTGDYQAKAILADQANYKWKGLTENESADQTITFSIAKGTALSLTGEKSLRYNNTAAQTVTLADLAEGIKELANASVSTSNTDGILDPASVKVENGVLTYALAAGLTEEADGKTATITVTFDSKNFANSTYTLTVTAMKKVDVSSKLQFMGGEYTYTGSELTHETAKVTDPALTGTITYEYSGDRKNVGTFTVTATYEDADNSGTATVTVTVKPAELTVTATAQDKPYDAKTDAALTVSFDGLVAEETLTLGTDYTVTAAFADKNAGADKDVAYTVTLDSSVKNYVLKNATGTVKAAITPATVTVTVTAADGTYNGKEQKNATVSFAGMIGEETLAEGTDYTVTYADNVNAGTARVTVEAKAGSNYTFEKAEETFEIAKIVLTIGSVRPYNDKVYDGTVKGDVGVFLQGVLEGEEVDYTVEATFDNKNVGTNRVIDFTIVLADSVKNYVVSPEHVTGRVGASILPKEVTVTVFAADVTYTGAEHKHATATFQGAVTGETLAEGTDYTVTYEANVNAGTAKVTVEAKAGSNYTFEKAEKTFTIAKAKVTGAPAYTPITDSGKTLADAALAVGTLTPAEGTLAWALPTTTAVEANTAYDWTFTPSNTNYEALSGSLTPYVRYSSANYVITLLDAVGGKLSVNTETASAGRTITVTATPDSGRTLATLTVTDDNGTKLTLRDRGEGKYSFTMPKSNVTVEAVFTAGNPFQDVASSEYYYDAVLWAGAKGITNGTSATTFSPNADCTRAQMVTFLWRASGSPEPKATTCAFSDVDLNSYYGKAVLWAVENGITNGTSATKFSPDASCTRAQMATFLCRMADGKPTATSSVFTDVAAGMYYTDAVLWAYENGITNGTSATKFSPDAACPRAQMVTFLYRFFVK